MDPVALSCYCSSITTVLCVVHGPMPLWHGIGSVLDDSGLVFCTRGATGGVCDAALPCWVVASSAREELPL